MHGHQCYWCADSSAESGRETRTEHMLLTSLITICNMYKYMYEADVLADSLKKNTRYY